MTAIWYTVQGSGVFAAAASFDPLMLLQLFTSVLAVTALLLSAAIAERERAERRIAETLDALQQREDLLKMAQRAGGVATFEWDFHRQTARCSEEFFRLFGLPPRDGVMPGAEWATFVHPEDRERMATHLAHALAGTEPAATDYRIITADGRTRWLSYSGQVERTAAGDRMLGTVVDITARRNAEAALRESRDVLALAMRGGAMGAWSRNVATNDVWWSPELEEIFGLPAGAFSRTEAGFFAFVHDDDRPLVREAVDTAVDTRTDYIVEFRFRHASGEWRWMEGRGRAVYADDGSPLTLYGIGMDITERKRAELALREAKAAAESASELKDQFLAMLSHELRTPLTAILGYARLLKTNALPEEMHARAIAVIERNAVAQTQLVNDLLDMSRISAGSVYLETREIAPASVLRDACDVVKPTADAKGIAIALDLDAPAATVIADAARLQQVFWNLLANAVKFTPGGGRVAARVRNGGAHVEVTIADTGTGIAPEFLPYVFEPFRQADSQFEDGRGGLGLGLAIARQLVELHGGTIHAASDGPGHGATFTVTLPTAG